MLFLDIPAIGCVKKWKYSRDSASFLVAAISHLGKWPEGATFTGRGTGPVGEPDFHIHLLLGPPSSLDWTLGLSKEWRAAKAGSAVEGPHGRAKTSHWRSVGRPSP